MQRRQKEATEAYEAQWAGGKGSFHPDYDPEAAMSSEEFQKATRETEELYNAIVKNDVAQVGIFIPSECPINLETRGSI